MTQKDFKRFFIELAYDGTAYHGWQIQKNANTIQQTLEHALTLLCGVAVQTTGCGRTDTGVHARQFFAHFDLPQNMDLPNKLVYRLNAVLPVDIVVKTVFLVADSAHARFDALNRSYEYHIHFQKDPFLKEFSWQIRDIPDIDKMNQAAEILTTYKDFTCFSKSNTQVFTNNCKVDQAFWTKNETGYPVKMTFHISADRFLRNMVRAIVGTLLEIGHNRKEPEHIRTVIESKNRSVAGISVPAKGLYLASIVYPEELFIHRQFDKND